MSKIVNIQTTLLMLSLIPLHILAFLGENKPKKVIQVKFEPDGKKDFDEVSEILRQYQLTKDDFQFHVTIRENENHANEKDEAKYLFDISDGRRTFLTNVSAKELFQFVATLEKVSKFVTEYETTMSKKKKDGK